MRPDMRLDYAVFQLTPNRTRCELHITAQGMTYKLASGLLKPFLAHLSAAEEQVAGGGYTIRLEPPDPGSATWFTKGTMERFVRFVSTPEVLERVGTVEMELAEIEETIRAQTTDVLEECQTVKLAGNQLPQLAHSARSTGGFMEAPASMEEPAKDSLDGAEVGMEEFRKQQLSRFLDARRTMLLKEQGMAFARASAAGFNIEQMGDLMLFATAFGATRLREACTNFQAACQKRKEPGQWQGELKLAATESAQAEMVLNDNMVNFSSSREQLNLEGRGVKKHDEFRRASLPGDARLFIGDTGLEKLTRRGSLDELTGEFWQVAARMRATGMMDGVGANWSSNWQMPSGRSQLTNEEMQAGSGHGGSNSDKIDTESGPGLTRGHPIMPAWSGHPQSHFMHNIHPFPLHGSLHPSLPLSLGMASPLQSSLSYPAHRGHSYLAQAYGEGNGWQIPPHIPPPYWSGHPGYDGTPTPNANEHGEVVPQTPQNKGVESSQLKSIEDNGDGRALVQRLANTLPDGNDVQHGASSAPLETPSAEIQVNEDTQETNSACRPTSASDLLVSQNLQVMEDSQMQSPASTDCNTNELPPDVDTDPRLETTRRLPVRTSSPSRRSASPLRKVQIGRSGTKKSVMVNIRGINHITHTMQEGESNDRESSGSWSEDNEARKSDEEVKPEPVRARVQDVIGLFESRKDTNESHVKSSTRESRRLSSQNSVLSRWTDSTARKEDAIKREECIPNNKTRTDMSDAFALSTAGRESKQPNASDKKEGREKKAEEDNLQDPHRQWVSFPKEKHPFTMLTEQEQDENKKHAAMADLSISSSDQPLSDDSFIVFEQPVVGKEAISNWKAPSHVESEMTEFDGGKCDLAQMDDAVMAADQGKNVGNISSDMPAVSNMQVSTVDMVDVTHKDQDHSDEESPSRHVVYDHEDVEIAGKLNATNSKKVSNRDAKARVMQEMLEKRKAASGNQSGKLNPLAEAQSRADKLRAYKAGLQKSKQEKEEEEKRRIEDLKSQRKERIAKRGSPVGGASSQSPPTKQALQTPTLRGTRSSQTAISQKLSGSSPRSSTNATASALSPSVPKFKVPSANKIPRTSPGAPKANENVLASSVPSLSELTKDVPKTTLAVRSSTGSQRLSQLKKSLKDADPNSPLNANGHAEEKKRSSSLATIRKGIPPAKDIKGESLASPKPTKGSNAVNKQQKKRNISPKGQKSLAPKESAMESNIVLASVEQVGTADAATMEAFTSVHESEAGVDSEETSTDNPENYVSNECSFLQDDKLIECESGDVQIKASASIDVEEVPGIADGSVCLPDESKLELPSVDEVSKLTEESKLEASNAASASDADLLACPESEHVEAENDINEREAYHAPITHMAHMSPREEFSATCNDGADVNKDAQIDPSDIPLAEEYNPPRALLTMSPIQTPSKSLPRLHEAIQQAHSPEHIPGVSMPRKKGGDSGMQKASKDHAKGLKRLLLLGRKSQRSSAQNTADWVSVSMTSEVDDAEDAMPSNIKSVSSGSATANAENQADRLKSESTSGSSSVKGSRSFFSLSTFRGKSEGKS